MTKVSLFNDSLKTSGGAFSWEVGGRRVGCQKLLEKTIY